MSDSPKNDAPTQILVVDQERLGGLIHDNQKVMLVIVDASLTPVQQRNLERAWDCKVIDRTGLTELHRPQA
mgnify:CR=1 FL=1